MFPRGVLSVGRRALASQALTPACVVVLLLGFAATTEAAVAYLQNGTIKIGVDLSKGGSITYLANMRRNGNLINSYDLGRDIQQSYYSGPRSVRSQPRRNRSWTNWPWNPIQSGDSFGHAANWPSRAPTTGSNSTSKPNRCNGLNKVAGQAVFETWIKLDGNAARVRCRLTNSRTDDKTQYPGWHQESPAVYTVASLYRLFTYLGDEPFTGGGMTELPRVGPPWQYWRSTENWSAQVDSTGWGLGIYHPGCGLFGGGFTASRGAAAPRTSPPATWPRSTATSSSITTSLSEYQYDLIVGLLGDIRGWVFTPISPIRARTTPSLRTGSTGFVPTATRAFRSAAGCGSTWRAAIR